MSKVVSFFLSRIQPPKFPSQNSCFRPGAGLLRSEQVPPPINRLIHPFPPASLSHHSSPLVSREKHLEAVERSSSLRFQAQLYYLVGVRLHTSHLLPFSLHCLICKTGPHPSQWKGRKESSREMWPHGPGWAVCLQCRSLARKSVEHYHLIWIHPHFPPNRKKLSVTASPRSFNQVSLVVQWIKTPSFRCKASSFHPWSGNWDPHAVLAQPKINKIKNAFLKIK